MTLAPSYRNEAVFPQNILHKKSFYQIFKRTFFFFHKKPPLLSCTDILIASVQGDGFLIFPAIYIPPPGGRFVRQIL